MDKLKKEEKTFNESNAVNETVELS